MKGLMEKFLDLMQQSVVTQFVLAVGVAGTICYLYIAGRSVPETLAAFAGLILGFYFGSKRLKGD